MSHGGGSRAEEWKADLVNIFSKQALSPLREMHSLVDLLQVVY